MANEERGRLDGVPPPVERHAAPAGSKPEERDLPSPPMPYAASGSGFEFNNPSIVSLLYLSSVVFGITALVGVVLAYIWRNEAREEWEVSHYRYLINTFWIGFVGAIAGVILLIVLIGLLVLPAVAALVIVRSVLSLINAQKRMPMPNPGTLLA